MKFKILTAVIIVLLLLPFSVLAAESEYSINLDENYTVGYTDKDLSKVAKITGMDTDALKDYCTQNGVVFVAVNGDNSEQMRLFAYETKLSKSAGDFAGLSDAALKELTQETGENCELIKSGETPFIKCTEVLTDSGGVYTSCQYVTVKNGKVYQFSTYNSGDTQSESVKECFESLKLNSIKAEKKGLYGTEKTLVSIGLLILSALIVLMIYGVIKDLAKKNNADK